MHRIITAFISLLLFETIYGQETCLNGYQKDAVNWVRELIKQDLTLKNADLNFDNIALSQGKCRTNAVELTNQPRKVYAFLSFSVPIETWLELSNDLNKVSGVVVLRGIPNNSFVELVKRIQDMDKAGLAVPIQIDPLLFEKFAITQVPSYVVVDGNCNKFDKVTGNISVKYALDFMASKGETEEVKRLAFKLRGNEG